MTDRTKKLFEKVRNNNEAMNKFLNAKSKEEMIKIAKEYDCDLKEDDFAKKEDDFDIKADSKESKIYHKESVDKKELKKVVGGANSRISSSTPVICACGVGRGGDDWDGGWRCMCVWGGIGYRFDLPSVWCCNGGHDLDDYASPYDYNVYYC